MLMHRRFLGLVLTSTVLLTLGYILTAPGGFSRRGVDTLTSDWHTPGLQTERRHSANTVHILLVVFGEQAVEDAYILITSITLLTHSTLHFHIYSTDNASVPLNTRLSTWPPMYRHRTIITAENLVCDKWITHMTSLNLSSPTAVKICMFLSLEQSDVVQMSGRVVFMDTDMIAISDVSLLWRQFEAFNSSHVLAMARAGRRYTLHGQKSLYGSFGLNSGLILMDIAKLLEVSFYKDYFSGLLNPRYSKYYDDQGLFNIYLHQNPERVMLLDCNWNFRRFMLNCLADPSSRCQEAETHGVQFLHATSSYLFTHSVFTPIYKCMQSTDFRDTRRSFVCLKDAIHRLHLNARQSCNSHTGFLKPLNELLL